MSSGGGYRQECKFGMDCTNSKCNRWHGLTRQQRNGQNSNWTTPWDGQPASPGQSGQGYFNGSYASFGQFGPGFPNQHLSSSLGQPGQGYPNGPYATFGQPTPSQHAGLGQPFSNSIDPYSSFGRPRSGNGPTEHKFMIAEIMDDPEPPTFSERPAFVTHLDGNNARCKWETGGSFKTVLPDNHGLRIGYRIIIQYDIDKVRDIRRCTTCTSAFVQMKTECSRQGLDLFCINGYFKGALPEELQRLVDAGLFITVQWLTEEGALQMCSNHGLSTSCLPSDLRRLSETLPNYDANRAVTAYPYIKPPNKGIPDPRLLEHMPLSTALSFAVSYCLSALIQKCVEKPEDLFRLLATSITGTPQTKSLLNPSATYAGFLKAYQAATEKGSTFLSRPSSNMRITINNNKHCLPSPPFRMPDNKQPRRMVLSSTNHMNIHQHPANPVAAAVATTLAVLPVHNSGGGKGSKNRGSGNKGNNQEEAQTSVMQAMFKPRTPLGFLFGLLALFLNRMNDGCFLDIQHDCSKLFDYTLTKGGKPVPWVAVYEALDSQKYDERHKQSMLVAISSAQQAFEARDSRESKAIEALWDKAEEIRKLIAICAENHGIIDSKLSLLQETGAAQKMYKTVSNVCVGHCNGQSYPFPSLSPLNSMLRSLKRENKTFAACSLIFFDQDEELNTFRDRKNCDTLYHFVRLPEMLKEGQNIYDLTYGDFREKSLDKFATCMKCRETGSKCGGNECHHIGKQRIGGEAFKLLQIISSKVMD